MRLLNWLGSVAAAALIVMMMFGAGRGLDRSGWQDLLAELDRKIVQYRADWIRDPHDWDCAVKYASALRRRHAVGLAHGGPKEPPEELAALLDWMEGLALTPERKELVVRFNQSVWPEPEPESEPFSYPSR